jgi:hypothetical protein
MLEGCHFDSSLVTLVAQTTLSSSATSSALFCEVVFVIVLLVGLSLQSSHIHRAQTCTPTRCSIFTHQSTNIRDAFLWRLSHTWRLCFRSEIESGWFDQHLILVLSPTLSNSDLIALHCCQETTVQSSGLVASSSSPHHQFGTSNNEPHLRVRGSQWILPKSSILLMRLRLAFVWDPVASTCVSKQTSRSEAQILDAASPFELLTVRGYDCVSLDL